MSALALDTDEEHPEAVIELVDVVEASHSIGLLIDFAVVNPVGSKWNYWIKRFNWLPVPSSLAVSSERRDPHASIE